MKALRITPNNAPEVINIDNSLESLQHEVEGYIEVYYPFDDDVALVVNEEGKISGLPLNRVIFDEDEGNDLDVIAGNFIVIGNGDEDFIDLTDEQVEKYIEYFSSEKSLDCKGFVRRLSMMFF